jgi:hypothetical protein
MEGYRRPAKIRAQAIYRYPDQIELIVAKLARNL